MPTTYLKRQKETKRLEKQRQKAERRTQRKLASVGKGNFQPKARALPVAKH